ncbi:MAG TPA: hypothetical protein VL860_14670 [Planctomycetota bacterium]|nr:hypothetical protein [Planctomycetota bacterium]
MFAAIAGVSESSIYLTIAIVGSIAFVLKLVLLFIGGHHGDVAHPGDLPGHGDIGHGAGHSAGDMHGSGDAGDHPDSSATFTLFSVQGVLAFLMGFGWMGLAGLEQWNLSSLFSLLLAAGFGFLMMLLSATLMYYAFRLEHIPVFDVRKAVGEIGQVYLNIPALGQGVGEVQIVVDGRQKVLKAKSTAGEIKSFTRVKVVSVERDLTLTVEPA